MGVLNEAKDKHNWMMDQVNVAVKELLVYEKVIIYCPSVFVCSYILIQLMVLAHFFDSHYDNNKEHQSLYEQWYGFWIMTPTFVFDSILLVCVSFERAKRNKNISERDTEIESRRLKKIRSNQDDNEFGITEDEDEDDEDEEDQSATLFEKTAEEEARVTSLNISLIQKWLWTTPTFFLAACKISWDHRNEYSWKFIFTPLAIYISYFIWVGIQKKNFGWQDQRDIDIAEKRQLQLDAIARALAVKRSKRKLNESGLVKTDESVDV
jgi:hypothetical protein